METMASVTSIQDVDSKHTALDTRSNQLQEMEAKWKRLKTLYNDLQEALEKSDLEVQTLMQERSSLREENMRLQKEKAKLLDLLEEADKLTMSLEDCKNSEHMAHQGKKLLEKRCLQLQDKANKLLHKICASEQENNLLRERVTKLEKQALELESYLDAKSLELREKDKDYQERESIIQEMTDTMNQNISTKEVLNNKIQELQRQLEESYQEISMRKEFKENGLIDNTRASDTIMYEIIQIKLEKQLEQAQMKKQGQGIQGFFLQRLLLNVTREFLWCSFSVGIFLLPFFLLMRLFHTLCPDYLLLDLRHIFSGQAIEVIQNILRPILKLKGVGALPI